MDGTDLFVINYHDGVVEIIDGAVIDHEDFLD